MNSWLSGAYEWLAHGFAWPTMLALAGVLLFLLLGIYSGLLLHIERLPRWLRPPHPASLRGRLILALTLVAALPAVSLALVLSERASHQRIERAATGLQAQADDISHSVGYLVADAHSALAGVANHIRRSGDYSPAAIGRWLQLHHATQPGLRSMLAVSRDGAVVAATVRRGNEIRPYGGSAIQIAATDPLRAALKAEAPFVSGAVHDPLRRALPAVLVSVPVRGADSGVWGIVAGALDPASIAELETWIPADHSTGLLISDAQGRVLFTTPGSGFRSLQRLPEQLSPPVAGTFEFELTRPDGEATAYIAAVSRLDNGWRVHRYRPYASLQAVLLEEYAVAFGWLVATIIISICLAIALAGSVAGPLKSLDRAVADFDVELDCELPQPPANTPREVSAIYERLNTLVTRLRSVHEQFRHSVKQSERLRRELTDVIANRETEIRNRTEELRRANAALEHMTRVDALTGLANRRALAEFLERTWRGAMREQQPVSIIVLDIDQFRSYNEVSGQPKGDTCLKAVADAIRQIVSRASDLVCRFGGEEFVVVLGNTPLDGALALAEQIRAAVQSLAIPHRGLTPPGALTVSAGVASTVPTRNSQPNSLLAAAERALHAAKELGRNQVAYSTAARTGLYQSLCLPNDVVAARPS